MGLSIKQIGRVIGEIETELIGGMIKKIDQPDANTLIFEIEQHRKRYRLFFSAHPRYARCHLTQQAYSNPKTLLHFCQLLRAHLRYKRIDVIRQMGQDRMVEIRCGWPKDSSNPLTFVAELTGPASTFFLLDAKRRILGMLSRPQPSRFLSAGAVYLPPEMRPAGSFKETLIPLAAPGVFQWNRSLDECYSVLEQQEAESTIKKERLARCDEGIRRFKKRLNAFTAGLAEAEKSIQYQLYGEYLKCHLHEIQSGADHFKYVPYAKQWNALPKGNSDEKAHSVPLDPALSPAENMAHFFKRYKKGLAGKLRLIQLSAETQTALRHLESGRRAILNDEGVDLNGFPFLQIKTRQSSKQIKKGPPVYLSSDQIRLTAGRNDRENEEITFRIARGNDLWFHAREASGAHVLVNMAGRKELPYQTLLEAATLALHFSRFRKEGKGEVLYTYKKYIQRLKKGKPGTVICSQEKTVYLEIDAERLSKVLNNRMDEAESL